ncbi:Thoeris anti-defense Tad2 family protein [Mitsuokella jalaludinii]|uniref:Thoeris anti-defense Tad2 family protein n=1 Tax=Mitsuokella jalaludinii TaxID=187979 RepID=UPI0030797A7B
MVFGDALEQMKAGQKMTRRGWPFDDIVYAEYTAAALQPYLVVKAGEREAIPYTATDIDLFADDWEAVQ